MSGENIALTIVIILGVLLLVVGILLAIWVETLGAMCIMIVACAMAISIIFLSLYIMWEGR